MKITIRNKAGIPNKYVRFIKWKIRNLHAKYNNPMYLEVYITSEGSSRQLYKTVLKLGVPGYDIVIKNRAYALKKLWSKSVKDINRSLRKHKEMQFAMSS